MRMTLCEHYSRAHLIADVAEQIEGDIVALIVGVGLVAIVAWCATRYNDVMIKTFRHKGLRRFFESGSAAGIQPHHAPRLRMQLAALDTAQKIEDMNIPGFRLHPLKGRKNGRWSIWVNGSWRLTFQFRNGDAYVIDYEDYH